MLVKNLKRMEVIHGFIQVPAEKKAELLGDCAIPIHTKLNDCPARIDTYGRIWSSYLRNKFPVGTTITLDRYEDGFKVVSIPKEEAKVVDTSTSAIEHHANEVSSSLSTQRLTVTIFSPKKCNQSNLQTNKIQMTLDGIPSKEDWDFARADTSYLTHKLHDYPARMIPQIAHRLVERYSPMKGKVLDPFCGSGTTLVESRLLCRNAFGNDVNPLAVLIARVKSTPIDFSKVDFDVSKFLVNVQKEYESAVKASKLPEIPMGIMPNLLHWFKEPVARDLEFLHTCIINVKNENIRNFLDLVFSNTVFKASNIDHRSSRFIRILQKEELEKFKPNVLSIFGKIAYESALRINQYTRRLKDLNCNVTIDAINGDARNLLFADGEFDCAVTSPPYGEEKNTVGYARWSKLSVAWLRLNGNLPNDLEKKSLGGNNNRCSVDDIPSATAKEIMAEVNKSDPQRIKDAVPFFFDYLKTMEEVRRVIKTEAYYCIVVGDRSIRKRLLDMEKVTVELAEFAGFKHINSYFRNIPIKLIPWNTPTGKTISRESIVILQKK